MVQLELLGSAKDLDIIANACSDLREDGSQRLDVKHDGTFWLIQALDRAGVARYRQGERVPMAASD